MSISPFGHYWNKTLEKKSLKEGLYNSGIESNLAGRGVAIGKQSSWSQSIFPQLQSREK